MHRRPGWASAELGEGRGGTGGLAELRAALLSHPQQGPIQPIPQSTRFGESGEQSGAGQAHSAGTALCRGGGVRRHRLVVRGTAASLTST